MATTSKMGIPYPASTDFVKDGATDMQSLAEEVDAKTGLVFIGSSTLTTVTNNISDVFSSTYNAYRVVVSDFKSGSATTRLVSLRFRDAGGDDSSANYFFGYRLHYGGTAGDGQNSAQTSIELGYVSNAGSGGGSIVLDIFNPNLSVGTMCTYTTIAYQGNVSNYVIRHGGGGMNETTAYTGFSIIGTTDNLSGTVRVYGYNQ